VLGFNHSHKLPDRRSSIHSRKNTLELVNRRVTKTDGMKGRADL
jgi:hypothetical protein